MILKSLTDGSIAGTGFLEIQSGIFGGALITADGTNAAVVTIAESSEKYEKDGLAIFEVSSKTPIAPFAPYKSSRWVYYSITGTGGAAQLFEWVP